MIYFDNAATTKMFANCIETYTKYACDEFYNPSALYGKALEISNVVKGARSQIAKTLGVDGDEIIFTASGSEADNIAMFCCAKQKKGTIIVGSVEHSAIFNCAKELENKGFDIVFAPCDKFGKTDLRALEGLLTDSVILVSIMHVCNETGAVNDLAAISKMIKTKCKNAIFHSDGVQAYGKIPTNLQALGVDLYSISAHKIHGAKGVGALFVSKNIHPRTFVFGGGQENNIRSATENVGGIAVFAQAASQMRANLSKNAIYLRELQTYALQRLQSEFPKNMIVNTNQQEAAPNIISVSFGNARGEVIVHCLEKFDIIVGTGSACSAKKSSKRIPDALKVSAPYSSGMLRLSFNEENTKEEIDIFIEKLKQTIDELSRFQRV
ncbi:MAG: cysteine desulfurase family protein [Clostridia bacterium]